MPACNAALRFRSALVTGFAATAGISSQLDDKRVVGALRTVQARAEMTIDPDPRECRVGWQGAASGIDQFVRMANLAAQRDGQSPVLRVHRIDGPVCCPADGKEPLAIWKFDELRYDHPGRPEGRMEVPDRA